MFNTQNTYMKSSKIVNFPATKKPSNRIETEAPYKAAPNKTMRNSITSANHYFSTGVDTYAATS